MVGGVTEEHAHGRTRSELVRSCGGEVWVSFTTEDAKMLILWGNAKKSEVRSREVKRLGREDVQQVGGST